MTSDHRSSSQRSYRSISSRKERRRNVKRGDDSDSDASSSDSDNSNSNESGDKSDTESFSGSEDNWEDDYHTSDNDSYYSKKNKDEEMGSDDDTSMPEGSEGSTTRSTSSRSKSKSMRSPKSPVSVKSTKSTKSKGNKRSKKSLKVIDSDIESDSESDSEASSNSGSSGEGTNSDSDSDEDSLYDQRRENKIVRNKLKAIALTALCFVLVTSAVVLGIVMGTRSLKNRKANANANAANAAVPTISPTEEPTSVPTLAPTVYVEPTPDPSAAPSERPTKIIITGEIPGEDDDFFNNDDFIDENGIPSETAEQSNGDTFVMTLPDGTPFEAPTKPGSSETLLVQGRNSRYENEPFANTIEDANSYALMNFNLGDQPWFETEEVLGDYSVNAYVCLEHVPDSSEKDIWGNAQYDEESGEPTRKIFSICRLKNSVTLRDEQAIVEDGKVGTGADVEQIENASYSMPEDCVGGKYEKFYVAPDDTLVCIEISQFVENFPPFVTEVQEPSSGANRMLRRRLLDSGIGKYNEDSTESDGKPRTPEGEDDLGVGPQGGSTIPANRDNATIVEGGDDLIAESRAIVTEEEDSPKELYPEFRDSGGEELLPEFRDSEEGGAQEAPQELYPEFRDSGGEELLPEFRDSEEGGAQEAPQELYPEFRDSGGEELLPEFRDSEEGGAQEAPQELYPEFRDSGGEELLPEFRDSDEGGDGFIAESRAIVTEEEDSFKPEPRAPDDAQEAPKELLPEFRDPDEEELKPEFRDPDEEELEFSSTGEPETKNPTASPTTIEDNKTKAPEIITDPSNFKNMLFMIANMENNQDARAQFYSHNSEAGPSLVLDLKERSPTVSPSPIEGGVTEPATLVPTVATPSPTFKAEYDPCGVCGNFASFATLEENKALDIPVEISPLPLLAKNPPDALNTTAVCTEWESTCNDGYCTPQLCESLLVARGFCGCAEPVAQTCSVCGEGEELEFPQAVVELTAEQSPNGEATSMTCSFLEGYCEAGFCKSDVCSAVQNGSVCSCKSISPSASSSTWSPSHSPTLSFPPTISPAPTFKAEFEPCSICGGPPLEFSLNATVVVELNEDITPSPVLNGKATCIELESLCQAGYCNELMCRSYRDSVATACGCSQEDNIFAR